MVVAIVAGLCVGVLSFMPLVFGLRMARNASPTSNLGHAGALLLGERMSGRELLGCVIMFAAIVLVQIPLPKKKHA